MHCHCGTINRAPRWTFMDPWKPEVRPGAREESASPAWLAAPAMNAREGAASHAGDADSSTAPGLTSGLQGSVNVHRGALLLVP